MTFKKNLTLVALITSDYAVDRRSTILATIANEVGILFCRRSTVGELLSSKSSELARSAPAVFIMLTLSQAGEKVQMISNLSEERKGGGGTLVAY